MLEVARPEDRLRLRLSDGRDVELDGVQVEQADVRLAYVQHPFPAQGQTTDTAHLIIGEHTSQHGSYVGLTRARERTDIYAATLELEAEDGQDQLAALAERMSHSELEAPSIDIPLEPEAAVARESEQQTRELDTGVVPEPEQGLGWDL